MYVVSDGNSQHLQKSWNLQNSCSISFFELVQLTFFPMGSLKRKLRGYRLRIALGYILFTGELKPDSSFSTIDRPLLQIKLLYRNSNLHKMIK